MGREVVTTSPDETRELGRRVGARLAPGDVILLEGDLGAGKTTFVKGVADACSVTSGVRSPTYAVLHRYRGSPDLIHVDLYRGDGGVDDLDWEAQGADAVTVVEWPRRAAGGLWSGAPVIRFEHAGEGRRRIVLPEALS